MTNSKLTDLFVDDDDEYSNLALTENCFVDDDEYSNPKSSTELNKKNLVDDDDPPVCIHIYIYLAIYILLVLYC